VANNMAHIELSRDCDAIVIAPASADFIAKLALGLADDLLSTLCLARECPLVLAPAMNRQMWDHPATQRNVERIRADAVQVLGPSAGDQACGEVGMGRMLEPPQIFEQVGALFTPKWLAGERVLITAGPTFEAIDAVRGITNRSSGKMGYALASAALAAGARVTLVSGPTELQAPLAADLIKVTSAAQMFDAVKAQVANADIFISVAAVADYTPIKPSRSKIKKSANALTLELAPTADILAHVASLPRAPFCVGFAAESENLHEYAEAKRKRKNLPLLAANLVQSAIGEETNQLILFDDQGAHPLARAPKTKIAQQLIEHIAKLYRRRQATPTPQRKPAKQK
jgi:phosphopantothenoylcysteine decarboxylase / phosphopantothenate---cysteine ligase